MEVYVAGCTGQSALFDAWLRERPEASAGVRYTGVFIPGANRTDYAALHPEARMRSLFLAPEFRASFVAGRVEFMPQSYSAAWDWLSSQRFDLVLVQCAPRQQDHYSLGMACDFTPAVLAQAGCIAVHANPAMPSSAGPAIAAERVDYLADVELPLLRYDAGPVDAALRAVGARVAQLIPEGATLQFGLGRLQTAVLEALDQRGDLRVHSGMISDPLLAAHARGVFAPDGSDAPPITCGVALGSEDLYRFAASARHVAFAPVGHTHAQRTLSAIPRLHSINSVLEVDLYGQVNGEYLDGQLVSGAGGLSDFVRGARDAPEGRAILALGATARAGTRSRIVPRLTSPSVSLSRYDADLIVTEFGVADLADADLDRRAAALIAIAAPDHRQALQQAWQQGRSAL